MALVYDNIFPKEVKMKEEKKPIYYRKVPIELSEETKKKIIFWDIYEDSISYQCLLDEIEVCPEIVKGCTDNFLKDDFFAFELALRVPEVRNEIPAYKNDKGFRNLIKKYDEDIYSQLMHVICLYCNNVLANAQKMVAISGEEYYNILDCVQYKKAFDNILTNFSISYRKKFGLKAEKKKKKENFADKIIEELENFYWIPSEFKRDIQENVFFHHVEKLVKPVIKDGLEMYLHNKNIDDIVLNNVILKACANLVDQLEKKQHNLFNQLCQKLFKEVNEEDFGENQKTQPEEKIKE